jgi:hypothetical protein
MFSLFADDFILFIAGAENKISMPQKRVLSRGESCGRTTINEEEKE